MPDDESGVETQFVAAMTMAYSDVHEASRCFEIAARLGYMPADPKTLRMIRTDLEKTRRKLHQCMIHIDTIERTALENLLVNARKHSPDNVPVVVEMGERETPDGKRAVIEVRDGGPGIPAELLPRLFDRFASGGNYKGLGLGLYISRGIAEAHGGTLTVDSKRGKGAALRLALPL